MNEETTVPTETAVDETTVPPTTEIPESVPETTDGTVAVETTVPVISQESTMETVWEDFSGASIEETIAETTEPVITVEIVQSVGSDIVHAGLFGDFLICGTLIGLALFRDRYGT